MPYIYRVRRHEPASALKVTPSTAGLTVSTTSEPVADEPSYRDLQAQAKAAGIKANQPADKLKKALGVGNG